jgi:hypothetical protein
MSYVTGGDGRGELKYGIESALIVECSTVILMTVGTLSMPEQLARVPGGCHIYAICTRPRLLLSSAELLNEEEGGSTFAFSIGTADGRNTLRPRCRIPVPPGTTPKIEDNGATIVFSSPTDELVARMPAALLLAGMMPEPFGEARPEEVDRTMLDLSVQYIGQAYGKDGNRNALDRLASHETLQKILGELNDRQPQQQAWIVVFKFDGYAVANVFGPWKGTVGKEESMARATDTLTNELPDDQLTTLAEGSLIRYFRPPFNERYKDTFPAAEHSSYEHPFEFDFNAVGFEFATISISVRLKSDAVAPAWIHEGLFTLSDPSVRRAFMDIFENPPTFLYPLFKSDPPEGWKRKEDTSPDDQ